MTVVALNVLFAIIGMLIAIGIPVAGLYWQRNEELERAQAAATARPATVRRPAPVSRRRPTQPRPTARRPARERARLSA